MREFGPYIIRHQRRLPADEWRDGAWTSFDTLSIVAVETLEQARHQAEVALIEWQRSTGQKPDPREHVLRARTLPVEGGVVELPDGSRITVEPVTWAYLADEVDEEWLDATHAQILAAFNAEHGSPS